MIDLKVKSDMLVEKLGDWIVKQSNAVKRSAADAFGQEFLALGQTLQNHTLTATQVHGKSHDEVVDEIKKWHTSRAGEECGLK